MKLFFSPGSCSLAPHIVLREAGISFESVKTDLKSKTNSLGDFKKLNPKGQVPALMMENGEVLTEGAVIMQYIADQATDKNMMPPSGTLERYRCMEFLNFIATELHKGFGPLWGADHTFQDKAVAIQVKEAARASLGQKFDFVSAQLQGKDFLMGSQFTVADAYLFTILNWCQWTGIDLSRWPTLMGFMERMKTRPAVHAALEAEGLLRKH